ncbi:MAG: JAB domain-containing protein [Oscillospiraceae bacterium]|nr:JAB domain-containing protein [Oscillospiraceae bacterium]
MIMRLIYQGELEMIAPHLIFDRRDIMGGQKIQIVHLQMVKDTEIVYGREDMGNPRKAAKFVKDFLGDVDRECLVVCATDTRLHPVYLQVAGIGAINYCPVSIPDIFKAALLSNAADIILFHKHPAGDASPSTEDILITERVMKAGGLLGIPLLDHTILGDRGHFYSFREESSLFTSR